MRGKFRRFASQLSTQGLSSKKLGNRAVGNKLVTFVKIPL